MVRGAPSEPRVSLEEIGSSATKIQEICGRGHNYPQTHFSQPIRRNRNPTCFGRSGKRRQNGRIETDTRFVFPMGLRVPHQVGDASINTDCH